MKEFQELFDLVKHLRVHCPWDREQTFESIQKSVLEEAQELTQAIDKKDWNNLCEELGDTFFNLLFVCNLAQEQKLFTPQEVLQGVHDKMIRRHPHVFGDVKADSPEAALAAFNEAKKKEKEKEKD